MRRTQLPVRTVGIIGMNDHGKRCTLWSRCGLQVYAIGDVDPAPPWMVPYSAAVDCDVVVVAPTTQPLTRDAGQVASVVDVAERLSPWLRTGQLVSLESPVPPGTTEGAFLDGLRKHMTPEIALGIYVCYAPLQLPRPLQGTRLVAGIDLESTEFAVAFYACSSEDVRACSSPSALELANVATNMLDLVSRALAEEVAALCDTLQLDAWEVLELAALYRTTPPELSLYPSSCDVAALGGARPPSWFSTGLAKATATVLTELPMRWTERVEELLVGGTPLSADRAILDVYVLGLVETIEPSPSLCENVIEFARLLAHRGYRVACYDSRARLTLEPDLKWVEPTPDTLRLSRLVVIALEDPSLALGPVAAHACALMDLPNILATRGLLGITRCPVYTR